MTQSEWIYAILQEHGFEACVEAFKQNIQELRRDKKLEEQKRLCLQKLSVTTADRDGYIQAEISKYEKCMRDSISQASDTGLCSVYNVISIVWNYVLSEAIIAELKQQAVGLSQNVAESDEEYRFVNQLKEKDTNGVLQKAINGGLLNADYTTTDKVETLSQKALLAEILSERLGLKSKYKPFEMLWGVKNLAKARYKAKEETGKVVGGETIESVFKG